MNVLKRATDILGAAPLFIVFSAVFVLSELTVMWILIPSTASSKNTQQDLLIDSFLNEDGSFAASDEGVIVNTLSACATVAVEPSEPVVTA